ncbi:co-chaperone GroES [Candidatus Gracilibacteria bacterium]|nr:co-chaperone GroES [Candidatus Gracilibacteria bacterium]NUJ99263.1 co-chaperone GroES [Candidatus Gracilibacteria bacterium]
MLKPLSDRVILKLLKEENTTTKSGIYIPDSMNKEKPFIYEVIAVGPGKKDSDMSGIKVGDKVICGQYSGDEIKVKDEQFKIVGIDYILAIAE